MGISGLLPLLKSIQRPTELKQFAGQTLGVDAYGWLHRGAIACAVELATGKPTQERYLRFAMHHVRMAKAFGVTPYLVFDGDFLPSKAATEASRAERREKSRQYGLELLIAGKTSEAYLELRKAVDVTPEMARSLIEQLKQARVPYIVAPYEADAQLVYLERHGLINGIISEDSDLLVFGAKRLLTKLDQYGQCIEINRRNFSACREISLTGWSDTEFRHMAILSGCDYLDNIDNIGLKTAYRMIRQHKTPERVIRKLQFDGKRSVPADYLSRFEQAELTFLYQRVFCPMTNGLVHLTPPESGVNVDEMPFLGAYVEPALAKSIADGYVDPFTRKPITGKKRLAPLSHKPTPKESRFRRPLPAPHSPRRNKSAESTANERDTESVNGQDFPGNPNDPRFTGARRIPLGEMDPNCFSVCPQRLARDTRDGQRPLVFPLPRPYTNETTAQSGSTSGSSAIPAVENGRDAELVDGQDQPRKSIDSYFKGARRIPPSTSRSSRFLNTRPSQALCTEPVSDKVEAARRRQTTSPKLPSSEPRPPKKARLCEDDPVDVAVNSERSKFFPSETVPSKASGAEDLLKSDDSVEEALKALPDVEGWRSTSKTGPQITVFEDVSMDQHDNAGSKDESNSAVAESKAKAAWPAESKTPQRPELSSFAYKPQATDRAPSKHVLGPQNGSRVSYSSSARSSIGSTTSGPFSTPVSAMSQFSSARSTPATPLMTPLQRIGVRALNGRTNPSTSSPVDGLPKRNSSMRPSIDSLPFNPCFVPLPPVDMKEVESLNQTGGSEDLMASESEVEETGDGIEHIAMGEESCAGRKKLDLSRFMRSG